MLYHQLLNGEHIDKAAFSLEHNITERSFDRDIEDIRLFLSEIYSASELMFDKISRTYYLTEEQPHYIDRMEAVAIGKILLSSSSLRYDEMMGLLHVLLTTVSKDDADAVRRYLCQGIAEYTSKATTAVLKLLGDLYEVILTNKNIEITLSVDEGDQRTKLVSPLKVDLSGGQFCLIAADAESPEDVRQYGANGADYLRHGLWPGMGCCWRRHRRCCLGVDTHCRPDCWRLCWRCCGIYSWLQGR